MPEPAVRPISILIVDDHSLFRESVARLLATETGFAVVGHCGSIENALEILRAKPVDLVLLDFDLGTTDGMDFMRLVNQHGFAGKVLVVTAGLEEWEAASLIQGGVSGIFMKYNSAVSLSQGIRDVMGGKVWFDQELLQRALARRTGTQVEEPPAEFTKRERQVLACIFEGLANKEIARRIGVSESSVKAALQQLFGKTGVRTRSQLVRIALEQHKGLL